MIGQTIGHFKILALLGAGGGGEVYRAEDMRLQRVVALKLIPQRLAVDGESLARFEREAKVLAALNHPHIVTIYSVDQAEGRHFLTMEYVGGTTLTELISPGGMSLAQFFGIALPLVDALRAAHGQGVIHRDLKPANIMVSETGTVKILDFGLAKLRPEDAARTLPAATLETITQAGVLTGTLQYMAPEQLEGKPVDGRTDLFSMGGVFHEMLTGDRAFPSDSGPSLISCILRDTPSLATELRPDVPLRLALIILRCLEKRPENRFRDAAELYQELEAVRREEQIRSRSSISGKVPTTPFSSSSASSASSSLPSSSSSSSAVSPSTASHSGPSSSASTAATATASHPNQRQRGTRPASRKRPLGVALAALGLLVLIVAGWALQARSRKARDGAGRIVVLPFTNVGQGEDTYFAAGITEEITSRLASVRGMKVVSRTSAAMYNASGKTIKQIGHDLNVDYVLEGSVSWDHSAGGSNRVRVTPQLVRVTDDSHLWSMRYEKDVNAIFEVQTDIARQVVEKLNITLRQPDLEAIKESPTENQEAYLAYLKGMTYGRGATNEDAFMCVQMLERAVTLDPSFALAYYRLTKAHAFVYMSWLDHTPERLAKTKDTAEKASQLAPNHPRGHDALGIYYLVARGKDKAESEFGLALQLQADDAEALFRLSHIKSAQGEWTAAKDFMERAVAADPQNGDLLQSLSEIFVRLRRFPETEQALDRAIALAPDDLVAYWRKTYLYWSWDGTPERARKVLEAMPKQSDMESTHLWILQECYERRWQQALDRINSAPWEWYRSSPKVLLQSLCLARLGQSDQARAKFEEATDSLLVALRQSPDDPDLHGILAQAYAYLGRGAEAIRQAEVARDLNPIEKDPYTGPDAAVYLAKVYAALGQSDAAVDQLAPLLAIPSNFTAGSLRLDPVYDGLRTNPRFHLLAKID